VQGIPEPQFVAVALGLSMLVFRPKWQERIKLDPQSALIGILSILVLIAIANR
jgi:hypothetical protein